MADFEIPDHYHKQFTTNVELLLQKIQPTFMVGVPTKSYSGESAQVIKQFGEVEFQERTERFGDTNFSELDHKQRWIFPTDYDLALPVDSTDELRMLNSPTSSYVEAMRASWARKWDTVVRDAALGNNNTGKNGGTNTALPASQVIGHNTTGLTTAKLRELRKKFRTNNVPEGTPLYLSVSENQIDDLLADTFANDADHNTVKVLANGDINTWMGFRFVMNTDLTKTGSNRNCIAWAEGGLVLGQWNDMTTHIGPRPDKKYINQVYMEGTIGATRTQEKRVFKVECTES